jgi:hypothetical protein
LSSTRPIGPPSLAAEPRLPLLDERSDALVGIGGAAEPPERILFRRQPLFEGYLHRRSDQSEHLARGERGGLDDRSRLRHRGLDQLSRFHDGRHERSLSRLLRREPPGGQEHVGGEVGADRACQPLGAPAAGHETQTAFRESEPRRRARDQEIAAERDLEAPAEGVAVHSADDRLREVVQRREQPPAGSLVLVESLVRLLRVLADIGTRDESTVARPDQHDDAARLVGARLIQRALELSQHRRAQRVQFVRTVEREQPDRVATLDEDEIVRHLRRHRHPGAFGSPRRRSRST